MGIYREDFSAKSFNRPEWKKLIAAIKGNKGKKPENILFVKWDRFSRNIQYAYEMIGILRNLNTQAVAIDQPIDFDILESLVMLAVYLSIPEAENNRRAKWYAPGKTGRQISWEGLQQNKCRTFSTGFAPNGGAVCHA